MDAAEDETWEKVFGMLIGTYWDIRLASQCSILVIQTKIESLKI
jgi:hypothetical protein